MVTDGVACNNVLGCSEDDNLGFVVPGVPPAEDPVDAVVDLTVGVTENVIFSEREKMPSSTENVFKCFNSLRG